MAIIDNDAPKRRRVGLIYDERMCKHAEPDDNYHPENPNRIRAIWDKLNASGLAQRCIVINAKEAKDRHLALVHSKEHIKLIKTISSKDFSSTQDTAAEFDSIFFNDGSSEASSLAAGSVIEAAEKVAKGELDSVFAIVRPPGHHAEETEPMGFCLYNNVAIAASFLLNRRPKLGVGKILIVDWDVHHGNGTQKMFYKDPRVLTFSVHRHDSGKFYPYGNDGSHNMIGEGAGEGYNINVPWKNGGCTDADYFAVWDHILIPVAKEFDPDLIMIAAGFDAALNDPLGGCCVSPHAYAIMLRQLMEFARGKIVMALEGGYNLVSLANSVQACVEVLLQDEPVIKSSEDLPLKSTGPVIRAVRKALIPYWPVLASKLTDKVINSRPTQTEDAADCTASAANSNVEQGHTAERANDQKSNTRGELMRKFMFDGWTSIEPGAESTSPVVGPTEIELQSSSAPNSFIVEKISDPHKGQRPPKRPRTTTAATTTTTPERSSSDEFSVRGGKIPQDILQRMRDSISPRDKEIFSNMSREELLAELAYSAINTYMGITALKSHYERSEEERRNAIAEANLLRAKCESYEQRVQDLENEVSRVKNELTRSVEKIETVRVESYKKGFDEFAGSDKGRAMADRYREAVVGAVFNSKYYLSKAAALARFYYCEAFRLAQEEVRKAGLGLVLDPRAYVDQLSQETPGWNGNPDEPVDHPWWDGIYDKLLRGS